MSLTGTEQKSEGVGGGRPVIAVLLLLRVVDGQTRREKDMNQKIQSVSTFLW